MDLFEDRDQTGQVHRLLETVAYRLGDERVIGYFPITGNVLEARRRVWKHGRHQVVGLHALQLRRHLLPAATPRNRQGDGRVPSPARLEQRGVEKRLDEDLADRSGMQILEDIGERERVLLAKRQQKRVFGRGRLQFEVELPAETLAQRQRPRLVDPAAERGMQYELHAA